MFKLKIEDHPVNADLCMAFDYQFSFAAYWLQTLVEIDTESCQTPFSSF